VSHAQQGRPDGLKQEVNRYFRAHYLDHGQAAHTPQRNLIQLFNFLERDADSPALAPTD